MSELICPDGKPSIDEIAGRMYEDFEEMNRTGYEWDGGTIRPWDYESEEDIKRALEGYAPMTSTEEIEATFRHEETESRAEFAYDVSHLRFEETLEGMAE